MTARPSHQGERNFELEARERTPSNFLSRNDKDRATMTTPAFAAALIGLYAASLDCHTCTRSSDRVFLDLQWHPQMRFRLMPRK